MKRDPDESPYWRRKRLRSQARSEIALGICLVGFQILQIWAASIEDRRLGWPTWASVAVGLALIAWGVRRYRANVDPRP